MVSIELSVTQTFTDKSNRKKGKCKRKPDTKQEEEKNMSTIPMKWIHN
jgi:hypothetical protein